MLGALHPISENNSMDSSYWTSGFLISQDLLERIFTASSTVYKTSSSFRSTYQLTAQETVNVKSPLCTAGGLHLTGGLAPSLQLPKATQIRWIWWTNSRPKPGEEVTWVPRSRWEKMSEGSRCGAAEGRDLKRHASLHHGRHKLSTVVEGLIKAQTTAPMRPCLKKADFHG